MRGYPWTVVVIGRHRPRTFGRLAWLVLSLVDNPDDPPPRGRVRERTERHRRPPSGHTDHRERVRARGRWQVFGLAGSARPLGAAPPNSRRFPGPLPSAGDGFRSRLPLRGSPGIAPGSLLRHAQRIRARTDRSCNYTLGPPERPWAPPVQCTTRLSRPVRPGIAVSLRVPDRPAEPVGELCAGVGRIMTLHVAGSADSRITLVR